MDNWIKVNKLWTGDFPGHRYAKGGLSMKRKMEESGIETKELILGVVAVFAMLIAPVMQMF